jgi:hypothetical protein
MLVFNLCSVVVAMVVVFLFTLLFLLLNFHALFHAESSVLVVASSFVVLAVVEIGVGG